MTDRPLLTIGSQEIPSGAYSVAFESPSYRLYRDAKKRYPTPERMGSDRVPYSIEELLFAMTMRKIDQGSGLQDLDPNPKDVGDRLAPFPIPDRQFIILAFTEAFFISADQAQAARDLAEKLQESGLKTTYTIPADQLPVGSKSITFRSPNTGVQFQANRRYQGPQQHGCSLEEFLLSYCLVSIGEEAVEEVKDPISLLDEWEIADVQFAVTVFVNMFTLDSSGSESAKKVAGGLRQQLLTSTTAPKKPSAPKSASSDT